MRIKLDENLPATLAEALGKRGHDAETAPNEGLSGRPDSDLWEAAQREGRFLITQDLDFSDIRRYEPGTHVGLLLIRLRVPGRAALIARVEDLFRHHPVETWGRCFVVATDRKLRIRRPGK